MALDSATPSCPQARTPSGSPEPSLTPPPFPDSENDNKEVANISETSAELVNENKIVDMFMDMERPPLFIDPKMTLDESANEPVNEIDLDLRCNEILPTITPSPSPPLQIYTPPTNPGRAVEFVPGKKSVTLPAGAQVIPMKQMKQIEGTPFAYDLEMIEQQQAGFFFQKLSKAENDNKEIFLRALDHAKLFIGEGRKMLIPPEKGK